MIFWSYKEKIYLHQYELFVGITMQSIIGEVVSGEELGGATMHCSVSGITDHFAKVVILHVRQNWQKTKSKLKVNLWGPFLCIFLPYSSCLFLVPSFFIFCSLGFFTFDSVCHFFISSSLLLCLFNRIFDLCDFIFVSSVVVSFKSKLGGNCPQLY